MSLSKKVIVISSIVGVGIIGIGTGIGIGYGIQQKAKYKTVDLYDFLDFGANLRGATIYFPKTALLSGTDADSRWGYAYSVDIQNPATGENKIYNSYIDLEYNKTSSSGTKGTINSFVCGYLAKPSPQIIPGPDNVLDDDNLVDRQANFKQSSYTFPDDVNIYMYSMNDNGVRDPNLDIMRIKFVVKLNGWYFV